MQVHVHEKKTPPPLPPTHPHVCAPEVFLAAVDDFKDLVHGPQAHARAGNQAAHRRTLHCELGGVWGGVGGGVRKQQCETTAAENKGAGAQPCTPCVCKHTHACARGDTVPGRTVFPEPVWPYANSVTLYPSTRETSAGETSAKTSSAA
jgi:hypothetical protein